MSTRLSRELDYLKQALTKLDATGHNGFEGLLACIFTAVTNKQFRLAGSGSQHGKDGSTAEATGMVAFEAKCYTGYINKNEVFSKLTEIIGADRLPDLWVLGATIEVKTQIVDPLVGAAGKSGINLLILDWSPASTIPSLVIACALARNETIAFLEAELDDQALVSKATATLAAVADHERFEQFSRPILEVLHGSLWDTQGSAFESGSRTKPQSRKGTKKNELII